MHGYENRCKLKHVVSQIWTRQSRRHLTIPVARNQNMIDIGRAMMYLTCFVKFIRRKKLPTKPHAKETAFKAISLYHFQYHNPVCIPTRLTISDPVWERLGLRLHPHLLGRPSNLLPVLQSRGHWQEDQW